MISGHVLSTLESDVRNILQFQLASFFPALWLYDVYYVTKKLGSLGTRLIINTTIIPTIHYLQPLLQQVWLHMILHRHVRYTKGTSVADTYIYLVWYSCTLYLKQSQSLYSFYRPGEYTLQRAQVHGR